MKGELSLPCWSSNHVMMRGMAAAKADRANNWAATYGKEFPRMLNVVKSQDMLRGGRISYLAGEKTAFALYKCWYDTVQVRLSPHLWRAYIYMCPVTSHHFPPDIAV